MSVELTVKQAEQLKHRLNAAAAVVLEREKVAAKVFSISLEKLNTGCVQVTMILAPKD